MSESANLKISENVALAPLTTLKVGGAARFFVRIETEDELRKAVEFAEEYALNTFVLGGGSNILIADEGFDGLVLHIAFKGIERRGDIITAGAGENWDEFVAFRVAENLQGVECLSGIPGTVGGTPVQNVGAYGQEVSETIVRVRVYDRKSGEILELDAADCKFSYRTSIFNSTEKDRFIVTRVTFKLAPNGAPKIVYKDLREFFGARTPNLAETREAVLKIRRAKSMVIDDADENSKSAGSFFKNPIVSKREFEKIAVEFGATIVPHYRSTDDSVKISAAWLIEQAGFGKGFRRGKVGISTKHSLAVVNFDGASARDVVELKNLIQAAVEKKFGVRLHSEPVHIGFKNY